MPGDKTSIIKLLGLPEAFAVVLLILSLIIALAPYLPGKDFGVIKIPEFTLNTQNRLKVIGPIIFLVSLVLFLPLMTVPVPVPPSNINRNGNNDRRNDDIDLSKKEDYVVSPDETRKAVQRYISLASELYKQARYDAAIDECEKALTLEPDDQEAIELRKNITEAISIMRLKTGK
ncbi:MAG TPA: tetratricopeptide repeat protein [Blastocatellia bacterium]|nr:tetratricopeptide repeat protein [Blastocatellia bacterium]